MVSSLESISFINSSVDELSALSPSKLQNDDLEDTKYKSWLKKQDKLKQNIKKVCNKYGSSLRKSVPSAEFMFDSEHNLLFCRNAKVAIRINFLHFHLSSIFYRLALQLGWHTSCYCLPPIVIFMKMETSQVNSYIEKFQNYSNCQHLAKQNWSMILN